MDSGKLIADVLIHGFIIRCEMKMQLHNLALTNYSLTCVNRCVIKLREIRTRIAYVIANNSQIK